MGRFPASSSGETEMADTEISIRRHIGGISGDREWSSDNSQVATSMMLLFDDENTDIKGSYIFRAKRNFSKN